jgi:diguanylate cyclase (GGDEF)-like protein
VGLVLVLVIATLGIGIALSESQTRSHILSMFRLRGTSSATFVSTFLTQQADRQQQTAGRYLSGPTVSPERFGMVVSAFGSSAAVLVDSGGRLLDAVPADRALTGRPIAQHYAHLTAAEQGRVAVSGVVRSAVRGESVVAVAVPFSTAGARRVFSTAYPTSGSTLGSFVDHTIAYRPHEVYLVDGAGNIIAASPKTGVARLQELNPALVKSMGGSSLGAVRGASTPSTFSVTDVPGTSWRVVIEVPNNLLFASIDGWTQTLPWLVFAIVSVFAIALLVVFARLTALSERMARSARTDALTGLANRRALNEHLTRATARARRTGRPVSVLMIDLDRFKQTNDRYGHRAGDRVLRTVADCMREAMRGEDIYGRWGGDEFFVLLPDTDEREAARTAERLRRQAGTADLRDIGLPGGVPLSIGVATRTGTTPEDLVQAADLELYEQKAARRKRDGTNSSQLKLELSR